MSVDLGALFADTSAADARSDRLAEVLFAPKGDAGGATPTAYLLVDASCSPDIEAMIEGMSAPALCLFDGATFEDLSHVAPWLVELKPHADVWDWFLEEVYGRDRGIMIRAGLPIAKVKTRMKRFLRIIDDEGQTYFFKFYRPRHLATYLPEFDASQRQRFFQDGLEFMAEAEDGSVDRFRLDETGALRVDRLPIDVAELDGEVAG